MPLSVGDKLGPYEILVPIGAGGSGAVYRARDPRMGREVAIKVSAACFGDRFERKVRAVAALNHPYCTAVLLNRTCAGVCLDSAHSARSTGKCRPK